MASSIKAILRKKPNQDGTFPIALRVTNNRSSTYVYLKQNLKESEWDAIGQKVKKACPNSVWLNNLILAKKEINDQLLQLASQKKDTSVAAVRKTIKQIAGAVFSRRQTYTAINWKRTGSSIASRLTFRV